MSRGNKEIPVPLFIIRFYFSLSFRSDILARVSSTSHLRIFFKAISFSIESVEREWGGGVTLVISQAISDPVSHHSRLLASVSQIHSVPN